MTSAFPRPPAIPQSVAARFGRSVLGPRFDAVVPLGLPNPLRRRALDGFCDRLDSGEYVYEEIACTCGSREYEPLAVWDQFNLPSFTVFCSECAQIYNKWQMSSDSLSLFYRDHYREIFNPEMFSESGVAKDSHVRSYDDVWRYVRESLDPGERAGIGLVGEIGCDAGQNLVAFREHGCRTVGVDHDRRRIEAGRRVFEMPDLHEGGAERLKEVAGPVDLLILSHVLEHFRDIVGAVADLQQAVRPGGYMYVAVPSFRHSFTELPRDPRCFVQLPHNYYFDAASLQAALAPAGFRCVASNDRAEALFRYTGEPSAPAVHRQAVSEVIVLWQDADARYLQSRAGRSGLAKSREALKLFAADTLNQGTYRRIVESTEGLVERLIPGVPRHAGAVAMS